MFPSSIFRDCDIQSIHDRSVDLIRTRSASEKFIRIRFRLAGASGSYDFRFRIRTKSTGRKRSAEHIIWSFLSQKHDSCIMEYDFDIIVIGAGAGGGTLAAACATAGRRVLLVERGNDGRVPDPEPGRRYRHDEHSTLIEKRPYDDRVIQRDGRPQRAYIGGVFGGGTAVYGGALLRPAAADFQPGRSYGNRLPPELQEWPIQYGDLEADYDAAERIYGVRSAADDCLSPLESPAECGHLPLLPLARINQQLIDGGRRVGLNPFRLPLAIQTDKCLLCDQCAGFVCPTGARRSSAQLVSELIQRRASLTVMRGCEVEQLKRRDCEQLEGIVLRRRADNTTLQLRARRYVLSAGALGSPALLLKSGYNHPLIGRNYMMHYSPIVAGFFAQQTEADRTFVKQIGVADFYFGTSQLPEKMGIIQSLPAPGPLMMSLSGMKRMPTSVLRWLRSRMLPLVGIIEDLPDPRNRVEISRSGDIQLHHRFTEYDRLRGNELSRQMVRLLKAGGAFHCVSRHMPTQEHLAHQCGTLRFGVSAAHAVANPECRLFQQRDVFVADGSFMPSSLGVGPSLTIIANALRVARIVAAEVQGC